VPQGIELGQSTNLLATQKRLYSMCKIWKTKCVRKWYYLNLLNRNMNGSGKIWWVHWTCIDSTKLKREQNCTGQRITWSLEHTKTEDYSNPRPPPPPPQAPLCYADTAQGRAAVRTNQSKKRVVTPPDIAGHHQRRSMPREPHLGRGHRHPDIKSGGETEGGG